MSTGGFEGRPNGLGRPMSELVELLQAPQPRVRVSAAQALGAQHATQAIPSLIEMAQHDPEFTVRPYAIEALGKIGDRATIPLLQEFPKDDKRVIRHAAVYALGLIGDPTALPAVLRTRQHDRRRGSYLLLGRPVYRKAIRRLKAAAPSA